MNKKGTRSTNGEGYIGDTIQKIDRKKNRKDFVCDICKACQDWSICNNREGTNKCQKCVDCIKCLEKDFCDRFYCYKIVQAQIYIDGKQSTVANKKTRKDAVADKRKKECDVENGTFVKKNDITLYQLCKKAEKEKIDDNIIDEATVNRNKNTFSKIRNSILYTKPAQKVTKEEIKEFINSYNYLSQSQIDKITSILRSGCMKAIEENIIPYNKNPFFKPILVFSKQNAKDVVAFEVDEVITLIKYLLENDRLIINNKCNYDSRTIRNLIILSLLSLTRIRRTNCFRYRRTY